MNTTTNQLVDALNRAKNDAVQPNLVSDVRFEVVPDPTWVKNSVVIIETSTKHVIENLPVDENGWPIIAKDSIPL
ncbi:hypothetical protein MB46_06965 [Arthrobacter alpinus]|uniref:hypothetical protein n=1 Tax=Arthrobacter alpinus TaxID=656366 RepID=UPI0005CA6DDA|nr:hypothetical protein [Arthrobacter alpinus]ALV45276.1 hypothetical protein MB46_06965 [Arthrobacter alpinus]